MATRWPMHLTQDKELKEQKRGGKENGRRLASASTQYHSMCMSASAPLPFGAAQQGSEITGRSKDRDTKHKR